ncbi:hypothetical protein HNQ57_002260 [Zhongshania antarctica]|uniref:Uncharacterized protein n=1 Tax=Zhongshania antarctica TaxID=641702 RepID=A0A840R6J1_9GAMM|nr:hypothetical protein [Zhongshania antarctica]MBB5187981.1 hypothetical protein [Zhongshania antarctica]
MSTFNFDYGTVMTMQEDLAALNKQALGAAIQHMGRVAWPTVALTLSL